MSLSNSMPIKITLWEDENPHSYCVTFPLIWVGESSGILSG